MCDNLQTFIEADQRINTTALNRFATDPASSFTKFTHTCTILFINNFYMNQSFYD